MPSRIAWYGERGIVNAMVESLASADDHVGGTRPILRKIRWADGMERAWVGEVTGASFLVEVGMGQSGSPDLIIAIRTGGDKTTHVVFVEAKVVPYLGSALSNLGPGMAAPGYNSSINGQLALRHRLARSLANWRGVGEIEEDAAIHAAYRRHEGGLGDPSPRPRRLAKDGVLGLAREHGLGGLDPDRYHLVAWTWDDRPFFDPSADVPTELKPLLLSSGAEDVPGSRCCKLGWIGFGEMNGVGLGDAYDRAVSTMLTTLTPTRPVPAAEIGELMTTENFGKFRQDTLGLVGDVEDLVSLARCNATNSAHR